MWKHLSTCEDNCLSFIRRQIFSNVDKFFHMWTNFYYTICPYETTMKDKNFPIQNETTTCNFFKIWLYKITIVYSTKKPDKWKKHSVSIFVLTTVFEKMCPHLIWDVLSYLSRKKGISETFLSLGLFISRPRPTASASKMRPRLQKTFPRFPFFYFGNFGQISNQTWTNFSSDLVSTKIETKYYFFFGFYLLT